MRHKWKSYSLSWEMLKIAYKAEVCERCGGIKLHCKDGKFHWYRYQMNGEYSDKLPECIPCTTNSFSKNNCADSMVTLTEKQKLILEGKLCPYCGRATEFIDSSQIYGKNYGMIYICRECNAYVGVHEGTVNAKGRLANSELRKLKKEAHEYFDKIWKQGSMKRFQAYNWLSSQLNIPIEYTHIGMFSDDTCRKVIRICKAFTNVERKLEFDFNQNNDSGYFEH